MSEIINQGISTSFKIQNFRRETIQELKTAHAWCWPQKHQTRSKALMASSLGHDTHPLEGAKATACPSLHVSPSRHRLLTRHALPAHLLLPERLPVSGPVPTPSNATVRAQPLPSGLPPSPPSAPSLLAQTRHSLLNCPPNRFRQLLCPAHQLPTSSPFSRLGCFSRV